MLIEFQFCDQVPSYDTGSVYFARLGKDIGGTDYLINALFYLFVFPGYFGFNWDALSDCLTDFTWINEKHIILYHEELPQILDDDLKIYLKILNRAALVWREDDEHDFTVYFMNDDRKKILQLLK